MTPVYEFSSPSKTPACDLTRRIKHSPSCSSESGITPVYKFPSPSNFPETLHPWTPPPLTPDPLTPVTRPPRALQFPQSDSIESEEDAGKPGATGTDYVFLRWRTGKLVTYSTKNK